MWSSDFRGYAETNLGDLQNRLNTSRGFVSKAAGTRGRNQESPARRLLKFREDHDAEHTAGPCHEISYLHHMLLSEPLASGLSVL